MTDPAELAVPIERSRQRRRAFLSCCLYAAGAGVLVAALRVMDEVFHEWPGWVGYREIPSPNFNDRPLFTTVNCLVLHSTAQPTLLDTVLLFESSVSKVSAHFVVGKDGSVVQMVPLTKRAWHAGVSTFDGVAGVNDYSIGIEMANMNDGVDPYPESQYLAVAQIIDHCRKHYTIPDDRIVSHAEIALPPGRKSDPKGFDFGKLRKILAGAVS